MGDVKMKPLDALIKVVDEAGVDYQYKGTCSYVRNDEPSCIMGRVLHKMGAPLAMLVRMDCLSGQAFPDVWGTAKEKVDGVTGTYEDDHGILTDRDAKWLVENFTEDEVRIFGECQGKQDGGDMWGRVRNYAMENLPITG